MNIHTDTYAVPKDRLNLLKHALHVPECSGLADFGSTSGSVHIGEFHVPMLKCEPNFTVRCTSPTNFAELSKRCVQAGINNCIVAFVVASSRIKGSEDIYAHLSFDTKSMVWRVGCLQAKKESVADFYKPLDHGWNTREYDVEQSLKEYLQVTHAHR